MRATVGLFLICFICGCNNAGERKAAKTDTIRVRQIPADTALHSSEELPNPNIERYYIWSLNSEEKIIRKNPDFKEWYRNVDTLIAGLNALFPEIKLEKRLQSNDTLYTQIKNSTYLTEKMGSSGAESYIAQAVLNLTAVSGVKYVRIDFEPGDHAEPDVWSKKDFRDFKQIK